MKHKSVIIGAILGVIISGYTLVYVPMSRNYEECGQLTLCPTTGPDRIELDGVIYERAD